MLSLDETIGNLDFFLAELEQGMLDHGLALRLGPMDHICYRAASNQEYLDLQERLAPFGPLLIEGMIGGRPISTFKLNHSIPSAFGPIPCLELAAPKAGKLHTLGLEHGEIVVPSLTQLLSDYPWVPFNRTGLTHSAPELTLSMGTYQIKFHSQSLADTIAIEIASNQVISVPADYFTH
ncbi:VOC family protein [Oceanisphaera sp. W20_SRM_FM3]|uniref:VOC family protein n=1 Tax=Oceanisphaera sp. W20_SRM_FM3 TaxID=3240267 RepID=UPI003F9838BA